MLNVYLTYVSTLETSDVEISSKVYTSHGRAVDDIESMIQQYVFNRKSDNSYKIVSNEEFDIKKLNKDFTIPIGGYVFRQKKSTVCIYKKVISEGRIWNGSKLQKVGKIGVLPEINIPVDNKLLKLIETIKDNNKNIDNEDTSEKITYEIPIAPIAPEIEPNGDEYVSIVAGPSNYEHGIHVSFIQELKDKLDERNKSDLTLNIETKHIEPCKPSKEHLRFISDLEIIKSKLNHITPPPSPILGRVIENITESSSLDIPDFPSVPYIPPCPSPLEFSKSINYSSDWDSSSLSDSSDWDNSREDISQGEKIYSRFNSCYVKDNGVVIPTTNEMYHTPDHIEHIVDSIIKTINLNNKVSDSSIVKMSPLPCPCYDEDICACKGNEFRVVEYYEDKWNINPFTGI